MKLIRESQISLLSVGIHPGLTSLSISQDLRDLELNSLGSSKRDRKIIIRTSSDVMSKTGFDVIIVNESEGDKDFAECSDMFVLINLAVTGCNSVLCLDQESN